MDNNQLLKQMIDFNRTTCETALNAVSMFQEQVEKAASANLEKAAWLPGEGRTIAEQWFKAVKSGREGLKKSVDENFKTIEAFFIKAGE